jgi:hypothetical protein
MRVTSSLNSNAKVREVAQRLVKMRSAAEDSTF